MKKRLTALMLCFVMLAAILLDTAESRAATVYFTAANDTLLELSDSTMPFWNGSLLYVPTNVFSSGGLSLNVSYNSAKKTLIMRQSQLRLICNISSGMTVDSNGKLYDFVALERGGNVFVPINAICQIFGLSCVTRTVEGGNLVRVRNDSAALSDDAFLTAAAPMIASRYAEYQAAHNQTNTEQEPDDEQESKLLYLALTVRSAAAMEGWLDVFSATTHHVTFFLTKDFLTEGGKTCADLVRRALAEGHSLGLLSNASAGQTALEELEAGNRALAEVACIKTRMVQVRNSAKDIVSDAGYCPVVFDRSINGSSDLTTGEIYQLLGSAGSGTRLDLGDSMDASTLRTLLSRAASRSFITRSFRETAY